MRDADGAVARLADGAGALPLHLVCANAAVSRAPFYAPYDEANPAAAPTTLVGLIVDAFPEAHGGSCLRPRRVAPHHQDRVASQRKRNGHASNARPPFSPEALATPDAKGRYPLHHLMANEAASDEAAQILLTREQVCVTVGNERYVVAV